MGGLVDLYSKYTFQPSIKVAVLVRSDQIEIRGIAISKSQS